MTYSTETYTQLIKQGRDCNQDLRLKLSSMPSCTEQEMQRLDKWLEETKLKVNELSNLFLLISDHLRLLEIELQDSNNNHIRRGSSESFGFGSAHTSCV